MRMCADMRLAIWTLLQADPDNFFCLIAVVCTSFAAINQGTARRTPTTPWGDVSLAHVVEPHLFIKVLL